MGTFSVWHWLIVMAMFVLPLVAVVRENSDRTTNRKEFLIWIALWLGVPVVAGFVSTLFEAPMIAGLGTFFSIIITYPMYQRMVRRARDAGMGKTIAYIAIIPVASFVCALVLAFKGTNLPRAENIGETP